MYSNFENNLVVYLEKCISECDEKSPQWDKYTSRMSGQEAYEDMLVWVTRYLKERDKNGQQ